MEIYIEAVEQARSTNNWIKHPNNKRKGQDTTLVTDLESTWLLESDKNKK